MGGASNPAALADVFRNIVAETESRCFRYAAAEARKGGLPGQREPRHNAYLHTLGMLAVSVCEIERERLRRAALGESIRRPAAWAMS